MLTLNTDLLYLKRGFFLPSPKSQESIFTHLSKNIQYSKKKKKNQYSSYIKDGLMTGSLLLTLETYFPLAARQFLSLVEVM